MLSKTSIDTEEVHSHGYSIGEYIIYQISLFDKYYLSNLKNYLTNYLPNVNFPTT